MIAENIYVYVFVVCPKEGIFIFEKVEYMSMAFCHSKTLVYSKNLSQKNSYIFEKNVTFFSYLHFFLSSSKFPTFFCLNKSQKKFYPIFSSRRNKCKPSEEEAEEKSNVQKKRK